MIQNQTRLLEMILNQLSQTNSRIDSLEAKLELFMKNCNNRHESSLSTPDTPTSPEQLALFDDAAATVDDTTEKTEEKPEEVVNNNILPIPDFEDKAAYREWIYTVLEKLSGDGLSNIQICYAMAGEGILTPKGKRQWYPIGVQGMLNHINRKKAQEAENHEAIEFRMNQKNQIPHQDDRYREYSRNIIFQIREEENTLKQIVDNQSILEKRTGFYNKHPNHYGK